MSDLDDGVVVYKAPDKILRPGDVVRLSPTFRPLRAPVVHLGQETKKGERVLVEVLGRDGCGPVPTPVLSGGRDTKFAVPGKLELGVLLTRGCDIENGKVRQVAVLKPLSTVQGEEHQAAVIEGRHVSLHYLPRAIIAGAVIFEDSYVDLRQISTLHDDQFRTLERPVSLTREALTDLYYSWVRHTTGKEVRPTFQCPHCAKDIDTFAEVEPMIAPPEDY